ncbi:MAG: HNH endonuclease [Proteobacteria bacterium]|nr:HNH endonuclease [Pseudomonadota bacterium]
MIDNLTKDQLLLRAKYECEYCHRVLLDAPWQVEHVRPRCIMGTDDLQNLAVACPRCNLNKREATEGKDYVTGKTARFFNPRVDNWWEHFGVVAGQLVGITVIGRATALKLFRRTEQHLPSDLNWWPITNLKDEGVYRFLNHQRSRRLENKFEELQRALNTLPFLENVSTSDQQKALFATQLLLAETLYTRSSPEDIRIAFDVVNATWALPGLNTDQTAELLNVTSIILQQIATILTLEKKHDEARLAQERAAMAYGERLQLVGGGTVRDQMRLKSLQSKYLINELKQPSCQEINDALEEAKEGHLGVLTYTADTLIRQFSPSSEAEVVLDALNELLLSIGYGQDFDYARNIVVRRRWWILLALLGLPADLDLLENDLQFWKSHQMFNELRELSVALRQIAAQRIGKAIPDMVQVIESQLVNANASKKIPKKK